MSIIVVIDTQPKIRSRIGPAIGLLFLSPLVAEFFLGNVSIDGFVALIFLAPMYGGGALLIREFSRRANRGWPTILGLGVAYSVWEEAFVTQLLFNPSYHGLSLTGAVIPFLGVSATQIINILTLHTVWSVGVSICLVELFVPESRSKPWLGWFGFYCTFLLFLLGSAFVAYSEYEETGFFANGLQLAGGIVAAVLLAIIAFRIPPSLSPSSKANAPHPWLVLLAAFSSTSIFMVLLFEFLPGWPGVAAWAILVFVSALALVNWGRQQGWGDWHRLAIVAGSLLTYAWSSFPQQPVVGSPGIIDFIGNILFAVVSMILLLGAANQIRKSTVRMKGL